MRALLDAALTVVARRRHGLVPAAAVAGHWKVARVPPDTIESPCIQVCVIDDASGLCEGCGRTLAEIAGWSRFSTAERRRIVAELPARFVANSTAKRETG